MKKSQINVGGVYTAKVSGRIVNVRVDAIREVFPPNRPNGVNVYDITNLATGRRLTFRSAAKFRDVANSSPELNMSGAETKRTIMS